EHPNERTSLTACSTRSRSPNYSNGDPVKKLRADALAAETRLRRSNHRAGNGGDGQACTPVIWSKTARRGTGSRPRGRAGERGRRIPQRRLGNSSGSTRSNSPQRQPEK